ncbi:hypothetical protein [Sphingosinicella sp. BN140058]|uniref:hypothetical protein n=1 Tax=Sphingosinicella sp. BN140058 TaxID=1892855 RepID=UPI001012BDA9|nr:hypothetical protein [Sphingosinicella sp. BN140058]QAY78330.1 hypothetical protein ETR14_18660 [Sphingosinicella sp. BN140058]
MVKKTFIETGEGVFLRSADVVDLAGRMTPRETAITFQVDDWLIVEGTGAPIGQSSKAYYPVPNRPPTSVLRCRLRNSRRRLHALRAEGEHAIAADLELDIQATQDGTSSGAVSHRPPAEDAGSEQGSGERLCGRLLISQDRFQFIVDRLKQPGARLRLMLKLPLYKSAVAHAVELENMPQDLYLRHGETVPLTGYAIDVLFGPMRSPDEEDPD